MKWQCGCLVGMTALAAVVFADDAATTRPAAAIAPANAPVAVGGDVLVTPFKSLGDAGPDWVAKAVRDNLMTDLSAAKMHPTSAAKAFDDNTAAIAAGKAASSRFVIVGTFQPADGQLRFAGQILDVQTGQSLAGLSATGSLRDLFSLEDSLSQQTIRSITNQNYPGKPLPAGLQPAAVAQVVQPPAAVALSHYQGSALQSYVEVNRTPSEDFNQQVENSRDNNTFGSYSTLPFGGAYDAGYGYGYGYGYGLGSVLYGGSGFGGSFGYGLGGYNLGYGGGFHGGGGYHGGGRR
jgi:TolB-like protein